MSDLYARVRTWFIREVSKHYLAMARSGMGNQGASHLEHIEAMLLAINQLAQESGEPSELAQKLRELAGTLEVKKPGARPHV